MRRSAVAVTLVLVALLLSACGGGESSSGAGTGSSSTSASDGDTAAAGQTDTREQAWAKEVEAVMRDFENSSAHSVEAIHTSSSQHLLEPTYAGYSDELAKLAKRLEATDPPAACRQIHDRMAVLARKVSEIMGVLRNQGELSPEEFSALAYQQRYKFARVGRQLTNLTIHPHC